jgi:hypothetical protein
MKVCYSNHTTHFVQITMADVNRSAVARKVQEEWPGAYPGKGVAGKMVWTAITRFVGVINIAHHLHHIFHPQLRL